MRNAVVIGGGHNGLVCSTYLAKSGLNVTLIEMRDRLGGLAGAIDYLPGYTASITNSPGSFEGTIITELELERFGLEFIRPEVSLLHPLGDRVFVGWRDPALVASQFDSYAVGESERHRALVSRLDAMGAATGLSLWTQPTSIEEVLEAMPAEARAEFRSLILEGSIEQLLDESLRSDQAKAMMTMLGLNTQLVPASAPGSAMGLLMRPISRASSTVDVLGNRDTPMRGSVGLPRGSMASIVSALERAALAAGVTIRRGVPAQELKFGDERVTDVVLEDGERIADVDAVVFAIEPSRAMGLLPEGLVPDDDRIGPPEGSAFKIALALDSLPEVANAPVGVPIKTLLSAQFRIGPTLEYINGSIADGVSGVESRQPLIWGLIPSLTSPELAPEGKHLMSLNVWHAPRALGREHWERNRDGFVQKCIRVLEDAFPGLENRIEGIRAFTPVDLEDEFGLTGSNITHGDMLPPLLLQSRPGAGAVRVLRDRGVVFGAAGTWPGGYVTGAPGRNAAHTVLGMAAQMAKDGVEI